jgi:hypothetical protein
MSTLHPRGAPTRGFEPIGAKTPIQFNNPHMDPEEKRSAGSRAKLISDMARESRANKAEQQSRTFESMNMSVEDLLNEGEARFRRLNKVLDNTLAANSAKRGRLDDMTRHVMNVRATQGPLAARAADSGLDALRAKTTDEVGQGYKKSSGLNAAIDTSKNQITNNRAGKVARLSFSSTKNDRNRGEAIGRLGSVMVNSRSSDVLAGRGQLPANKFGTGADQRTNLAAMRIDSTAKRAAQAQAQSTAAKARNNANKPV